MSKVQRALPVLKTTPVSGLADQVLRLSAAQQWTSKLYPWRPGECWPLGAGRQETCGACAESKEWFDCKRLS